MKIAISGVSGYLGQLVAQLLVEHPEVDSILGLDVMPSKISSPKFIFQQADVRTGDFKTLLEGMDVFYHLAFVVEPPKNMKMATIDEINEEGSRNVFQGALAAGVPKIVHASSIAAYGAHADNPGTLTEDSPLRPNTDWYYSRAKGKVEACLDELRERHPKTVIIRFRPSVFLGPSINNSAGEGFLSRVLISFGKGLKTHLCWDEDIANAFVMALDYHRSDVFNLAGENPLTQEEAGRLLGKKVLHLNPRIISPMLRITAALRLSPEGSRDWVAVATKGSIVVSIEKAKERLGWEPRFDSPGTLLEFIRQHGLARGKREG